MSLNIKCPKSGSNHVQLSDVKSKHGCLWTLIFGVYYLVFLFIKWTIGVIILLAFDWWISIIMHILHKGYIFKCKGWFSSTKKYYYCHDCGYNFKI